MSKRRPNARQPSKGTKLATTAPKRSTGRTWLARRLALPNQLGGLVDLKPIQRITRLFSHATGMSASVTSGCLPQSPTTVREFCRLVRESPHGLMRCAQCDLLVAQEVIRTGAPQRYLCWAGLHEMGTPIIGSNDILGVLFAGQARPSTADRSVECLLDTVAQTTGIVRDRLSKAYDRVPVVSDREFRKCAELAGEAASAIGEIAELHAQTKVKGVTPEDLISEMSIIDWFRLVKQRTVLVLGKDTGDGLDLLREIQDLLSRRDYRPMLVKDHGDIDSMSNEQKVMAIAYASRFAVIENSYPAGQIDECRLCAMNRIVTATLRQEGKGSSFLVTDYDIDFPFMREFVYEPSSRGRALPVVLSRAVRWAEATLQKRQEFFRKLYPWRRDKTAEGSEARRADGPAHQAMPGPEL
ncbi:MAG: PocR ligand-binding domain-containing protein [Phycisphaerae bacterium]|nr:PocR ligand-binding domain-containing protein [Phycisphaerae bacterium]